MRESRTYDHVRVARVVADRVALRLALLASKPRRAVLDNVPSLAPRTKP